MKLEMRTFKNAFELQIVQARVNNNDVNDHEFCGQSYKHFTIVSYDSKAEFGQIFSQYDSREENYNHKVLYKIDHSTHTHTHSHSMMNPAFTWKYVDMSPPGRAHILFSGIVLTYLPTPFGPWALLFLIT